MPHFSTIARTGAALAGIGLIAACSRLDDVPPLSPDQLEEVLVAPEELPLTGLTVEDEFTTTRTTIQPGMGFLPPGGESNCADAINQGNSAEIVVWSSAGRTFSAGSTTIAVGVYSLVEGAAERPDAVTPARIYSDILTYCSDPIVQEGTGVEYTVDQLSAPGPDVHGMVVQSVSGWGERATMTVMHRQIGQHAVAVGSVGFSESAAQDVFYAQADALEEALRAK